MHESIACINSIFEQPWWLEAVAPGQWGAAEIQQDGKTIARLPYVKMKEYGCKVLGMPDYTQTLGYWTENTGAKNARKYSRHKDLVEELMQHLPAGYNVDMRLDHNCDYLFPFHWNGCIIQTLYSYRLETLGDEGVLWAGLADKVKTDIKKAAKQVTVEDGYPITALIDMQNKSFERQGRRLTGYEELLERLDEALIAHNARKLLCAVDAEGRLHAAAYFVYDEKCCYYLIGGGDPELRNSGASSLLVWEGIKFAAQVSEAFDFEGSMIEPIERFFRGFGGVPTPYWRITRLNTLLNTAERMKPKIKKLIGWK